MTPRCRGSVRNCTINAPVLCLLTWNGGHPRREAGKSTTTPINNPAKWPSHLGNKPSTHVPSAAVCLPTRRALFHTHQMKYINNTDTPAATIICPASTNLCTSRAHQLSSSSSQHQISHNSFCSNRLIDTYLLIYPPTPNIINLSTLPPWAEIQPECRCGIYTQLRTRNQ